MGNRGDHHHSPAFLVGLELYRLAAPVKAHVFHDWPHGGERPVLVVDAKDDVAEEGDGGKLTHASLQLGILRMRDAGSQLR